MLIIKSYVKTDWKEMRTLIMEMWEEEYAYAAVCYELMDPFFYEKTYLGDDHHIFIARDEKGMCGYIIVYKAQTSLEVVIVYVTQRKRRQGVSLALMTQIEIYGGMEGYKEIVVHSVNANIRSHKMKAKLGYTNTTTAYTSRKKL